MATGKVVRRRAVWGAIAAPPPARSGTTGDLAELLPARHDLRARQGDRIAPSKPEPPRRHRLQIGC